MNGNIKQSVSRWCWNGIPLDQLCIEAKKIGYQAVDLLGPDEYLKVKPFGLTCALLCGIGSIEENFNRKQNHERLEKEGRKVIEFAAAEGLPNICCFSGNRKGMPDEEGLKNCAEGFKRLLGFAEQKKVTLCVELLNSKVDHHDYMCDHTAWAAQLVRKVGSERLKVLYDIYHMQIMEGFIIETIKSHKDCIGHYHTGGVPGRHEIDETQELNYPAIMKAIVETGYQGYVAQEFVPARDPLTSLAQGFRICDV